MIIQEWKTFDHSDEQKEEIRNAKYGVLVIKNYDINPLPIFNPNSIRKYSQAECIHYQMTNHELNQIIKYLICKPHPMPDEYSQWLITGQPVFFRNKNTKLTGVCSGYFPPFAYPDDFDYSFDDFEDILL